eukprot:CAMPEP_0206437322 /NCGR_PEP_ID=MMETSP0324_2-20121206/10976_1 /ASSEMBLY_ACC=CAM_ASM_000836 /TAXON_ID=2866 /ORGANISM="Crypthecodinium cohnii, Strain Seligo" /LENGTH=197 /DNA_ID=CAMNT_0053904589 /DNA_START=17 /DNA_END=608 /DNA_ORIENTATION=+
MGSCIRYDLGPGESRHVDNGHLVAWTETVKYSLGLASVSLMNSLGSGEGLMCSFMGPGTVWIRTHKPSIGSSGKNQNEQRRNSSPAGLALFCCIIVVFMLFFGGMVLLAVMSDVAQMIRHPRGSLNDPDPLAGTWAAIWSFDDEGIILQWRFLYIANTFFWVFPMVQPRTATGSPPSREIPDISGQPRRCRALAKTA